MSTEAKFGMLLGLIVVVVSAVASASASRVVPTVTEPLTNGTPARLSAPG